MCGRRLTGFEGPGVGVRERVDALLDPGTGDSEAGLESTKEVLTPDERARRDGTVRFREGASKKLGFSLSEAVVSSSLSRSSSMLALQSKQLIGTIQLSGSFVFDFSVIVSRILPMWFCSNFGVKTEPVSRPLILGKEPVFLRCATSALRNSSLAAFLIHDPWSHFPQDSQLIKRSSGFHGVSHTQCRGRF